MGLLIFSIILTILIAISIIVGDSALRQNQISRGKPVKSIKKFALLSPLAFAILLFSCFTTIGANSAGVIFSEFGGIKDETIGEGLHIKSIFETVIPIQTTNKTKKVELAGQTKDSIYAEFQITLVYKIEKSNASSFYKATGSSDISEVQFSSIVRETLQANTIKFDIYEVMGDKLEELRLLFTEELVTKIFDRYKVTLLSTSFDDIDAGETIERIIQAKAEAMQQVEIATQEQLRATIENETKKIKAENEAQIAIILAKSKAEAEQLIQSISLSAISNMYDIQFASSEIREAFENGTVKGYLSIQEVTEIVLKQLYYNTWDGKLPEVITDSTGIIVTP